jgi:D-alanyl-D-alanine carboxypeptidase
MFRKLVSTGYYSFSNLNTGRSYSIGTTNALLGNVPGVQGMKTGYTNKAGYCFVGLSYSARGNTYISVVLGADSSSARWQDSRTLLTYAYNH